MVVPSVSDPLHHPLVVLIQAPMYHNLMHGFIIIISSSRSFLHPLVALLGTYHNLMHG